jgi:hypothetical protein
LPIANLCSGQRPIGLQVSIADCQFVFTLASNRQLAIANRQSLHLVSL